MDTSKEFIKKTFLGRGSIRSKMNKALLVIMLSVAAPLLVSLTSDIQLHPSQVLAQSNSDNNTTPSNNNTNLPNMVKLGETVVYRGIVSSEALDSYGFAWRRRNTPTCNYLPHRDDGALYTGVLTFTATKPVDIGFAHRLPIDNETLSQIEKP